MPHSVLEILTAHKSDRSYLPDPVAEADLAAILEAGHRAPSSHNAQEVSVVVVQSQSTREAVAALSGNQHWIAAAPVLLVLVMDYHKMALGMAKHGKQVDVQNHMEGLVAGCTDVGIVLANMMAAAHALGYGVVPIGGLRNDTAQMVRLLQLPQHVFPVVGLVVGHVKPGREAAVKPRLPLATFRHDETYHTDGLAKAIDAYDATLTAHWEKTGRTGGQSWSASMAESMDHDDRPDLETVLHAQGFLKK